MVDVIRLDDNDERDYQFDCGNKDLNEYFFKDSIKAYQELVSVTYAWCDSGKVLAYFCVSNDIVKREALSKYASETLDDIPVEKRYASLPAVKIGRLGVNQCIQSNGTGSAVLDFIKGWFVSGNKTGCRFIVVDALNNEDTIRFYKKNSFNFLSTKDIDHDTRLMFFDLIAIKRNHAF